MYVTHYATWAARLAIIHIVLGVGRLRAEGNPGPEELQAELDRLRGQQDRLVARSDQVLRAADAAGRPLTDDERRAIQRRSSEVEALDVRAQAIEAQLSAPRPRVSSPHAAEPLGGELGADGDAAARVAPMIDLAAPVQRPSARGLFGTRAQQSGESFGRFLCAVAERDTSYLLQRPRAAGSQTMIGADGGFAVPSAFNTQLLDETVAQSQFLPYCRVLPMTAPSQTFVMFNSRDRRKGPAGFVPQRLKEGAAATPQTPLFEEIELKAHKHVVYWPATREMLMDSSPGTDQALVRAAASALAMEIDREIFDGSGVGQLLGINAAPSGVVVVSAKDAGQTAGTVSFSNLSGMISRLLPSSFNAAIWLCNPATLPQLFGVYHPVKDGTTTVGGLPAPLTQSPDGSMRLFGRPLVVTDFVPVLSAQGDIQLLDLSHYLIGMMESLRFEVSTDALFAEDKVAFRVVQRRAGQPIPRGPITPAVGSAALSAFVQLEER